MKKSGVILIFLVLFLFGCQYSTEEPKDYTGMEIIKDKVLSVSYEIQYSREAITWIVNYKDHNKMVIETSENEAHLKNYMSIISDLKMSVFLTIYCFIIFLFALGTILYNLRKVNKHLSGVSIGAIFSIIIFIIQLNKTNFYFIELEHLFFHI